jgi:hypothetical protein
VIDVNKYPNLSDEDWFYYEDYVFIKPLQAVKYISLNFIATKTGITFDEIVGSFKND